MKKKITANSVLEKGNDDACSVAVTYKDFNSINDILYKQRKLFNKKIRQRLHYYYKVEKKSNTLHSLYDIVYV